MIDFRPFCGTDLARPYLLKPFSRGEYTYATDGRIMVRVPRLPDVPVGGDAIKDPDVPLSGWEKATYRSLPNVALPNARKVECEACEGRGYEHDCPDCGCECGACKGAGEIFDKISIGIGGVPFQLWLIQKMLTLPSVEVAEGNRDGKPLLFRFDGGIGTLMPMREPYAEHLAPFETAQVV